MAPADGKTDGNLCGLSVLPQAWQLPGPGEDGAAVWLAPDKAARLDPILFPKVDPKVEKMIY